MHDMMPSMRDNLVDTFLEEQSDELLTTGEAAKLLNSSRQHIVDLCNRGDLPYVTVGTHRRIRRSDVESHRNRTARMTRDQRRSLWLSYAVAGELVRDPARSIRLANENLQQLRAKVRGQASRWIDEWQRLLNGTLYRLLRDYTSQSPKGRELRQNSPFAGVLADSDRQRVLNEWAQHEGSN